MMVIIPFIYIYIYIYMYIYIYTSPYGWFNLYRYWKNQYHVGKTIINHHFFANGKHTTYKNGDDWGMDHYCFTHIRSSMGWSYSFLFSFCFQQHVIFLEHEHDLSEKCLAIFNGEHDDQTCFFWVFQAFQTQLSSKVKDTARLPASSSIF